MITLKKIRTLKDRTQLRKAALLMYRESEQRGLDDDYLEGLRSIVLSSPVLTQSDKSGLDALFSSYLASRDPLCVFVGADWHCFSQRRSIAGIANIDIPGSAVRKCAQSFGRYHCYGKSFCRTC